MTAPIRFFPGFVGSKAFWIGDIQYILKDINPKERHIVELFAGSAVISANCASSALLVDNDEILCRILSRYNEQIVPKEFTKEMYFEFRGREDWWKYSFCLQKMGFSSIFRYSMNGYNVPKRGNLDVIHIQPDYATALRRWKRLKPVVECKDYLDVPLDSLVNTIVIFDPPYEGSQAAYNTKGFDYEQYWRHVEMVRRVAKRVILFDLRGNIEERFMSRDILFYKQKKICPNGKYVGDIDAIVSLTPIK